MYGVACTDCHNPHPSSSVDEFPRATGVSFLHTNVARTQRRTMSVQQPDACYKCHAKIYSEFALPSHHPVKEGKMFCSDCHDPQMQQDGSLRAGRSESVVLQVPCGKTRSVRVRTRTGDRGLPHLPLSSRYCRK